MSDLILTYTGARSTELRADYRRFAGVGQRVLVGDGTGAVSMHLPIKRAVELRDSLDAAIEEAAFAAFASDTAIAQGRELAAIHGLKLKAEAV